MKRFTFLILLVLGQVGYAQTEQKSDQIGTYLTDYLARFNDRPASLHNKSYGDYIPIAEELNQTLRSAFPKHHFTIAKTLFSHWGLDDRTANILIVTENDSGKVVAHQWDLSFGDASDSFYEFLMIYPASSRDDALKKIKVFSSLMVASATKGSVGKVRFKGQTITAELCLWGKPWRILNVQVGNDNKFSRITMINAIMKTIVN